MSKFKSLENPLEMARAYFEKLESIMFNLIRANQQAVSHPFLAPAVNGFVGLLVVSSETGLCGVYNDHLFKVAESFIEANKARGIKLYAFGRKAITHFKKSGQPVEKSFYGFHGRLKPTFHSEIYQSLEKDFLAGNVVEVHVAYTAFQNAMKHHPVVKKLLGIDVSKGEHSNFIIESGLKGGVADVIPMYATNKLRLMMLESFTSEHSSRMVAMRAAKDNAKELMSDLILLRNKMRQAAITKEVIEIISSAEALKG